MEILFLIIGLALAGAAVYFVMREKIDSGESSSKGSIELLNKQLQELKTEVAEKDRTLMQMTAQLSQKETELGNLNERFLEQKKDMLEVREKFTTEFRNLANEILDEKSKKFTEQNKTNLDLVLKPLGEKLKDFEKKVEDTYVKEAKERFSLKEEVKRLAELNQQISKEASSLTKALKGESKTQGNWGEIILESILERTGLRKGHEFTVQDSFSLDDGKRYQSDIIVHYPGERSIVIDSKVTLTAYDKYVAAVNDEDRAVALKAHILSVKNHINELASKNYQDLDEIKTLDFVVLFMPIEPAYLLAIQNDPQLWSLAYEKRILLISPTNLVAVLKMIESLWKQEYQNKNVLEIAKQGGALYDDFVRLSENLIKLGKKIDDASGHYKDTMKKISEGRGNLIGRVEKLKALGVKAKKNLPDSILKRSEDSDLELE